MKTMNRAISDRLLAVGLIAALLASTTGCASLVNDANTAGDILHSAGTILVPVNPQAGSRLLAVGDSFKELATYITEYDKAAAAAKPGVAGKIQAVSGVITTNLTEILAEVRIKNPKLITEITVAVALANAVIGQIIAHLPQSTATSAATTSVRMRSAELPTTVYKNSGDLKKKWNDAIRSSHPDARL